LNVHIAQTIIIVVSIDRSATRMDVLLFLE